MAANDRAQVVFEVGNGRVALALVPCCDDENEGLGLRARL